MAPGDKGLVRRRVFIFFALFFFLAMLLDTGGEWNMPTHAVDEVGIAVLSFLILLYIALVRKDISAKALSAQRYVVVVFVLLMIAFQIYGIFAELGTEDFGNEIPVLIGLILMLFNGFI